MRVALLKTLKRILRLLLARVKKQQRAAETLGELGDYELLEVVGQGRSGCGLPGPSEESQSHSGTQDD